MSKERHRIGMNDLPLRIPHLMEKILQKLDDESLVKTMEVSRIWMQKIINCLRGNAKTRN